MRKALTCFILIAASAGLAGCHHKSDDANTTVTNEVVTVNETDMNATDVNATDANAMDTMAAPPANAAEDVNRGDPSNR